MVEFAYNNSYRSNIQIAPYEALYGKVRDVAFMEDENVFLRVLPMKGVVRFGKKGKLSPRYINLFEVFEIVGEVAYKHALSLSLLGVHLIFHVFMFQKYYEDKSHMLDFSSVQSDKNLAYEEDIVAILDMQVKKLRSKEIASVKVRWRGEIPGYDEVKERFGANMKH
ncbi:uncharacterized protein [Nicotiana tomentosiformis]|uniref:uncharacterized protein n=1 Tax=Nicotiana tomentosiformis TaxID=4098 RepID=UPI00388C78E5